MKNGIEYSKCKTKRIIGYKSMYVIEVLNNGEWTRHANGPYDYLNNARTEMKSL